MSVVYDYKFDSSGHDYLIRNSEALTQGETGSRSQVPDLRHHVAGYATHQRSQWCRKSPGLRRTRAALAAAANSKCGRTKAGGPRRPGYFYAASGEPGFRNVIIQIFDLKNPRQPKLVGRAWIPGLKDGEPGYEGQYSHHPIVDEENKRLYVGYRNAGGQAASFDISDPANPKLVWEIDMNPPHRGPHTVSPIVYDSVPNFGKSALPRKYAYIVDEAGAGDMKPCTDGVRAGTYMLDITTEIEAVSGFGMAGARR